MKKLLLRFYDILLSIYIYNEYTGYSELDKLLLAIEKKYPYEKEFIEAVKKHADDERKHYLMFRNYFKTSCRMPFAVTATYGYIDLFITHIFKKPIEDLNTEEIINEEEQFFKLCRLIMLTEFRGMKQVKSLLKSRLVKNNQSVIKIFKVIERDEPSHCFPYQYWLRQKNSEMPGFQEKFTDLWIHYSIMFIKAPLLFLNFRLKRMSSFYA